MWDGSRSRHFLNHCLCGKQDRRTQDMGDRRSEVQVRGSGFGVVVGAVMLDEGQKKVMGHLS